MTTMLTTAHTPGPWFAHGRAILNNASRRGDSCRQVADISDMPSSEMTPEELQANARLIAAAPDLLELARQIVLAAADKEGDIPGDIIAVARAAIARVTQA